MSEVSSHYVHFLVRRDLGNGEGWYAPYELPDDDPSGAGLAIAVDLQGRPFQDYWIGVVLTDDKRRDESYYTFRPLDDDTFQLETPAADIVFRERAVPAEERALPYLGGLQHPDFRYRLVEIEPVKDEVYDLMLGHKSVTIIGCNPFEQYAKADGSSL